jgi:hypothetical protein
LGTVLNVEAYTSYDSSLLRAAVVCTPGSVGDLPVQPRMLHLHFRGVFPVRPNPARRNIVTQHATSNATQIQHTML